LKKKLIFAQNLKFYPTVPGRPKWFIALGIAIAAAALSSYNAYRITELNNEISAPNQKQIY